MGHTASTRMRWSSTGSSAPLTKVTFCLSSGHCFDFELTQGATQQLRTSAELALAFRQPSHKTTFPWRRDCY